MKTRYLGGTLLASLLLASANAQTCSTLTTSFVNGTFAASIAGATAGSLNLLVFGDTLGTTTVGPLTIGLTGPVHVLFLGLADANGAASISATPQNVPTGVTVNFQAVGVVLPFSLPTSLPTGGGIPTGGGMPSGGGTGGIPSGGGAHSHPTGGAGPGGWSGGGSSTGGGTSTGGGFPTFSITFCVSNLSSIVFP